MAGDQRFRALLAGDALCRVTTRALPLLIARQDGVDARRDKTTALRRFLARLNEADSGVSAKAGIPRSAGDGEPENPTLRATGRHTQIPDAAVGHVAGPFLRPDATSESLLSARAMPLPVLLMVRPMVLPMFGGSLLATPADACRHKAQVMPGFSGEFCGQSPTSADTRRCYIRAWA